MVNIQTKKEKGENEYARIQNFFKVSAQLKTRSQERNLIVSPEVVSSPFYI